MKLNLGVAFALVALPIAAQAAENPIPIVAAENFYGEVALAIGGDQVAVDCFVVCG